MNFIQISDKHGINLDQVFLFTIQSDGTIFLETTSEGWHATVKSEFATAFLKRVGYESAKTEPPCSGCYGAGWYTGHGEHGAPVQEQCQDCSGTGKVTT